jgi:TrkA domain protein
VPGQATDDTAVVSTLAAAARLLDLRWIRIHEGSLLDGRTIGDADVRTWLNVTIAGIVSAGRFTASPGPEHSLGAGDIVAVVGDRRHVDGFEVAAGN